MKILSISVSINILFTYYTQKVKITKSIPIFLLDGIQWHFVINKIGEVFTIIVIVELLISRCSLSSVWDKFSRSLCNQNNKFNNEKVECLTTAVNNITTKIMNDDIVQNTLNNLLNLRKKELLPKNCPSVSAEFLQYIKHALFNLDKLIQEKPNNETMYKCIKINTLFVLTSHLFCHNDKKTLKHLLDLNTKVVLK